MQPEFTPADEVQLSVRVVRSGCCRRRVVARTLEEISYTDAYTRVVAPKGTISDLATIPSGLWCLVDPFYLAAEAVLHDVMYALQVVDRATADWLFLRMMKARGKPFHLRWGAYLAVRLFGGWAWEKHRRERAAQAGGAVDREPD